jgi:rhamnogalacturonyl hydrolase YesR
MFNKPGYYLFPAMIFLLNYYSGLTQHCTTNEFEQDCIVQQMQKVAEYQRGQEWKNNDRNWKRAVFYSGLMAFYQATGDSNLFNRAFVWGAKHGWRTGTEYTFPANRLACTQTYFELYFQTRNSEIIRHAKDYMDNQLSDFDPPMEQGWDYIDALFVGAPPYAMLGNITNDTRYFDYMNRMFFGLSRFLSDPVEGLFFRDEKAKSERSINGKKVIWSRGNGWIMASIPRILKYLPAGDTCFDDYLIVLNRLAGRLITLQGKDGMWRTNLADPAEYPEPESSGTAFFTYTLAWGINSGYLDKDKFLPATCKAWQTLYSMVNEHGRVCFGQKVSRGPGHVQNDDWDEYVSGAFLLAGSEILKLVRNGFLCAPE